MIQTQNDPAREGSIARSVARLRSVLRRIAVRRLCPPEILSAIHHWAEVEKEKQEREDRNRAKVEALVRSSEPILLELGAGDRHLKGWTTIDWGGASDLCLDLSLPLPFPDASVDGIYSSHVLEHFAYPQPLCGLLAECRRILKPKGSFSAAVPNARPYLEGYLRPESFDPEARCLYRPAYHYHSAIDYVNYIAYMDGHHRYMFDEENLNVILTQAGFEDARIREFDPSVDLEERRNDSIYAVCTKPG